jgi:hypothetical protein
MDAAAPAGFPETGNFLVNFRKKIAKLTRMGDTANVRDRLKSCLAAVTVDKDRSKANQ